MSLFVRRIFGSGDICPPQLEEVSSEILKKCGGSPLAIITVASLLANKAITNEEWERVYNSIGSTLEKDASVEEMRRILSLSYDDLPHHLKTCLLCLIGEAGTTRKLRRQRWEGENIKSRRLCVASWKIN